MVNPKDPKTDHIPTGELFRQLITEPLYQRIELVGKQPNQQAKQLRLYKGRFDMYCPDCGKSTTWEVVVPVDIETRAKQERSALAIPPSGRSVDYLAFTDWLGDFSLRIRCNRDLSHHADFYFVTDGPSGQEIYQALQGQADKLRPTFLIKVGQWPSLTDFQLGDLSEFEDGMSKQQRKEFVRATNTAAHGFFVAACVYYRRVFESVLVDAKTEFMQAQGMTEWPDFDRARTDERIRLLKDHLPAFMSDHPELYSILSLGVHELTEEECAAELPMLRKAIELIMEDRVIQARKTRERAELSRLLAKRVDRHKNR